MKSFPADSTPELTPAEALRVTFELFELAESMQRQNLRRAHPEATPEEIERLVVEWIQARPGAELGDACGRPRTRLASDP